MSFPHCPFNSSSSLRRRVGLTCGGRPGSPPPRAESNLLRRRRISVSVLVRHTATRAHRAPQGSSPTAYRCRSPGGVVGAAVSRARARSTRRGGWLTRRGRPPASMSAFHGEDRGGAPTACVVVDVGARFRQGHGAQFGLAGEDEVATLSPSSSAVRKISPASSACPCSRRSPVPSPSPDTLSADESFSFVTPAACLRRSHPPAPQLASSTPLSCRRSSPQVEAEHVQQVSS